MNCKQSLRELKINFHELPYGHELQNRVLHCGNITIMHARRAIHEKQRFSIHSIRNFFIFLKFFLIVFQKRLTTFFTEIIIK